MRGNPLPHCSIRPGSRNTRAMTRSRMLATPAHPRPPTAPKRRLNIRPSIDEDPLRPELVLPPVITACDQAEARRRVAGMADTTGLLLEPGEHPTCLHLREPSPLALAKDSRSGLLVNRNKVDLRI